MVKSGEESDKSGTNCKKEEKENTRGGTAGLNLCQFCGYRHNSGRSAAFGKKLQCVPITKLLCQNVQSNLERSSHSW